jgi:hypothetical protein
MTSASTSTEPSLQEKTILYWLTQDFIGMGAKEFNLKAFLHQENICLRKSKQKINFGNVSNQQGKTSFRGDVFFAGQIAEYRFCICAERWILCCRVVCVCVRALNTQVD